MGLRSKRDEKKNPNFLTAAKSNENLSVREPSWLQAVIMPTSIKRHSKEKDWARNYSQ